ncbi:hypothetical protein OSB04_017687 [Centaurea solstitialis]|uniref:PGG domain-containing protein n=1 Tax=Centaurea solstitialis TaxID=347529 RepID=A0AA38W9Q2_9ASTR|nr:hypothetical protein OSB04_017687 [Centaurea solstitialis]
MQPTTTTTINMFTQGVFKAYAGVLERNIEDLNTMKQVIKRDIPSTSDQPQRLPNLPRGDLLERSNDYIDICVQLYEASITGNWQAAKLILDKRPELVRFAITENFDTTLHVATSAQETKITENFVENLVNLMDIQDLQLQNKNFNTAFCLAAAAGNIKMVEIMMKKNRSLMTIPGSKGMMPLHMSALFGKYETIKYLYDASNNLTIDGWTPENRCWILHRCVQGDFFDIAVRIVKHHPELAKNGIVLGLLAQKPDAFNGAEKISLRTRIRNSICGITEKIDGDVLELLRIIWTSTIIRMPKTEVDEILRGPPDSIHDPDTEIQSSSNILFVAAEMGNTRFVIEILRTYPDLIWKVNDDNHTVFHIAVMHRHQGIYNLLYEIGAMKDMITPLKDKNGNNMLHLVGKTSVKMRAQTTEASLLMQRELLWFKEIEKMMPPYLRERKNNDGQTPYELFSEQNKDIVSQGLKWMKDSMVVATLIVTVAFAVAFTVPGGYDQEYGIPIYIHGRSFLVFVIADAISLFSSSTSLLVFLSILTSRHGQQDFMYSLPRKLMIGLATLFISVAAMMVTFSASFFVLYHKGLKWIPILITTFSTMPVIIFAVLQFPLLVDMFRSMYDSRYLFKPKKPMLYNTNPRF